MTDSTRESEQLRKALAALREMRGRFEELKAQRSAPIAVVGIGCRFPGGAGTPDALWKLVSEGRDAVTEVPPLRWPADTYFDPDPEASGRMDTRWGAFLDDVAGFDADFFGITPREAASMDPQQRILLEVAHEALEDASQRIDALAGTETGVFLGVHSHSSDYGLLQMRDARTVGLHTATGTAHSIFANRISYWLDVHGPSLAVDTACSSSLVAVHLAVLSLRAGECQMALAGGSNLMLTPESTVALSKMRLFAPDGRCKTFDASANGIVRGEGCGLVVLKRLDDALAANDPIRAVIVGSAVNQDGRTNGLTAPNGLSQQRVLRRALQDASIAPADVTYVETHGTGTFLGDPIEVEALAEVLGHEGDTPCTLGALKTNIGHLEGAAGIAGLIKAVLAIEHGEIPPNLHLKELNPHLAMAGTRLRLPSALEPWRPRGARVAGVSSFGFGGTNAHVILREPPPPERVETPVVETGRAHALLLSAESEEALEQLTSDYAAFLRSTSEPLARIAGTAALRRAHRPHRRAVVGATHEEMARALSSAAADSPDTVVVRGRVDPEEVLSLAFLYSGQGGQHPRMAKELLASEPVFRRAVEACDEALRPLAGWSLIEELADERSNGLERTSIAQPALFAVQVGLTELWRERGVVPQAVVGHSVGEIAAAWAAGVLTLEDAVRVVHYRGALIESMAGPGAMAVLGLPRAEVEALEGARTGRFSVAAVNGPRSVVISGDVDAVESAVTELERKDVFVRRLFMAHPFHGPAMEPVKRALAEALSEIVPRAGSIPFHSAVTGAVLPGSTLDGAYWGRNLREPVDFPSALLSAAHHSDFLEIGPHPLLTVPAERTLGARRGIVVGSLDKDEPARRALLHTAARLHVRGYTLDWSRFEGLEGPPARLPRHPWRRQALWLDPAPSTARAIWSSSSTGEALEASAPAEWFYDVEWQCRAPLACSPGYEPRVPPLGRIIEGIDRVAEEASWDGGSRGRALVDVLDALALSWTVLALRRLGWGLAVGDEVTDRDVDAMQLPAYRARLVRRLFGILEEEGIAERATDRFRIVRAAPEPRDGGLELAELSRVHPDHSAIFRLLGRCGPRVADVVRGVADPLDLLFPAGASADLRELYGDSPLSRGANRVVAELVERVAVGVANERGLRVLEVGAGTGSTTAHVLPRLAPRNTDYVFTDVSAAFLEQATSAFHGFTGFRTARFDAETDPAEQGFADGTFDVVLAANVLHATVDVGRALDHLHRLLAPGGVLILVEGVAPSRWVDLTFGLTPGWWRYEDGRRRGAHPLLSADAWRARLEEAGFEDSHAVLLPGERSGSGFTQAVLVARAPDGVAATAHARPRTAVGSALQRATGGWLLMHDGSSTANAVALRLSALGGRVSSVLPDDVDALRAWLHDVGGDGRGVLYFTADAPLAGRDLALAEPAVAALAARHRSIVRVVEALREARRAEAAPRLWLLTRAAQPVAAIDVPDPIAAAVWGLGRVIALEEPSSWGGLVDLPATEVPGTDAAAAVAHVLAADGEDQVAFRGGGRFVARLAPSPVAAGVPLRLRADGSYLVVGGLGRLGRLLAPWLASKGARRLVLLGRTPLPPREAWNEAAAGTPTFDRIQAIRAAEALGAEVLVEPIDVADAVAVRTLLEELRARGHEVRGIIHAAAFTEFVPVLHAEDPTVEETLRAKVAGTWILHALEEELGLKLDHFVGFSSCASVLGARLMGAYAGANQFLDALVYARRRSGLKGFVVNWGGWAGGPASEAALLEANYLRPMDPSANREALGRCMAGGVVRRAVMDVDVPALERAYARGGQRHYFDEVPRGPRRGPTDRGATEDEGLASRLKATSEPAAREALKTHVRESVASVMGLPPSRLLDASQGFFKLGMDSLMTVELRGRLQRSLGIDLPATVALEYPTVEQLSAFLAHELGLGGADPSPRRAAEGHSGTPPEQEVGEEMNEEEIAAQLDDALAELLDEG